MRSKVSRFRVRCARRLSGRILDLGAGEGDFTPYLGAGVVSLDVDLTNLGRLAGRRVAASADRIPFADDSFDGVWSCAVLEHVETNYLPEAVRVTRPGGRLFVLTPNRRSPWDPVKRLFGLGDWWSNEGHVRLYSVQDLAGWGRVLGEIWWAPGLDQLARWWPRLGHTLMLQVDVDRDLKDRVGSRALDPAFR